MFVNGPKGNAIDMPLMGAFQSVVLHGGAQTFEVDGGGTEFVSMAWIRFVTSSLNRGFLIHAEHSGVFRRVETQTDDISGLGSRSLDHHWACIAPIVEASRLRNALRQETLLPTRDRWRGRLQPVVDFGVTTTVSQHQNHWRAEGIAGR